MLALNKMSIVSTEWSGISSSNSNDDNDNRIELDYLLCFRDDFKRTRWWRWGWSWSLRASPKQVSNSIQLLSQTFLSWFNLKKVFKGCSVRRSGQGRGWEWAGHLQWGGWEGRERGDWGTKHDKAGLTVYANDHLADKSQRWVYINQKYASTLICGLDAMIKPGKQQNGRYSKCMNSFHKEGW
jgi:hypothetical protein